ncbi:MAG: Ldh family oxidoreductase [Pseudomonadota bacterium]
MPDVAVAEIETTSRMALEAHGAGPWQAAAVARAVARAEQTGNVICGLYYLESYCEQLQSGRVDGQVEPAVSTPRPGVVMADARFGFAQPAFSKGLPKAIDAARTNGVATLAVCHAHTCTSLGFFTEQIAANGLVGIGMTNATAVMAGPGGKTPVLGTNPFAITLPGETGPAMHADFSTASVALGKITMARAAGDPIPLGWAVDADGNPTTEPEAALGGALVPAAAHKGWALGLMVEALAAGMTGSVNSLDVQGLKIADAPPHNLGQFYILIDPAAHGGGMKTRFARVAEAIEKDPDVRIPGVPRRSIDPVPVPDDLWRKVTGLT